MSIDSKDYRVPPGKKVNLSKWPTMVDPYAKSTKEYKELLDQHIEKLSSLQHLHYASHRYALLLLFQGWTVPAKTAPSGTSCPGSIRKAARVFSFKQPSAEELEHDFLWRTTCRLSGTRTDRHFQSFLLRGCAGRRVHPEILRSQGLPEELCNEKDIWQKRYDSIVDLEKHLHRNGTQTVKIFLHLSYGEQQKRFLARIDEPEKNWKFSTSDIHERRYWKHYMKVYEDCFQATSTHHAPWYVVPADDKENARLIVSQIVLDVLGGLKMAYPKTTAKRRLELLAIKKLLTK